MDRITQRQRLISLASEIVREELPDELSHTFDRLVTSALDRVRGLSTAFIAGLTEDDWQLIRAELQRRYHRRES